MTYLRKLFLLAVMYVSVTGAQAQQNTLPAFIRDSLDSYIERGLQNWVIPGAAVAIVKDGEVVYIRGFGYTRSDGREPVDENTLFMIGSNTKAFTATTLSILQEEGLMSLNDKVRKWMPGFQLKDTLASRDITITDLLSHRIGFETFQGDFTYWTSDLTREQVIRKMALVNPVYGFRTRFGYCNAAFLTAGELIPAISGESWENAVKNRILRPLNMNRTLMLAKEFNEAVNRAAPYTMVDGTLREIPVAAIDNIAPAGSMSSSARDMTLWLQAQLNAGKKEKEQLLPVKALLNTRIASTIVGVNTREKQQTHVFLYGLGLFINERAERLVYSHTGGVDGFLSSLMFVPEENLGIVVLTNTDQNNFYSSLTNEILDAFLGLPYQDYSDKALKTFRENQQQEEARLDSLQAVAGRSVKPELPLKSYTGTYINELYGTVEIKAEKNRLILFFSHHPGLRGELACLGENNFLCTYSNPTFGIVEIPFSTQNKDVTGFTLHVSDFVEFTPYEFRKQMPEK
ncbi:MAG: serine hydrolase [Bacteroidota bacterium]